MSKITEWEDLVTFAWLSTDFDSIEHSILWIALSYTQQHPEWFADAAEEWLSAPDVLLDRASDEAEHAGDKVAFSALWTASVLAKHRPDLFENGRKQKGE